MAKSFSFSANARHEVSITLNSGTGLCDVQVSDKLSDKTYTKSMVLAQYNKLVDWLRENDHGFAMNSIHSLF